MLHPIPPVFDTHSRILILGSFPSEKSREEGFYYGHPQNRFWRLLSELLNCRLPHTAEEKILMLREHGIALWDVIASCEVTGSSDSSIRNVVANDLSLILSTCRIQAIFLNGKTAEKIYKKNNTCLFRQSMVKYSLPLIFSKFTESRNQ